MSLGKGKSKSKVKIPGFLRPFLKGAAGIGGDVLSSLNQNIMNPAQEFIAGFTPQEELSQILGTQRALDPNSGFQTAADVFRNTAEGTPISEFLPGVSMDTLSSLASGGSTVDGSDDLISRIINGGVGMDQLEATARGDFLYGGDGFNAALEAAKNKILPQVRSIFGRSGAGGGTGTLAEESFGRNLTDAFASQYGAERGRQDSAAGLIEQLTQSGGNFLNSRDAIGANASSILAGFGNEERNRQLDAAEALPGIENLDLSFLNNIGSNIRGLEQARIDAPFDRQSQFLQQVLAALGAAGAPIGQSSSQTQRSIGFGAN